MKTVLIAGATGYLGRYVVRAIKNEGYRVRILVRSKYKLSQAGSALSPTIHDCVDEIHIGDITKPETLKGICDGIDFVFSSVSLMGQKGRLTWHDVDYLGNVNILNEALTSNVSKFLFVSVFGAERMKDVPIVKAHEDFATVLAASGIDYAIIRPTGFFSDLGAFLKMAQSGRLYLLGSGEQYGNPVHGSDLAKVCVDAIKNHDKDIEVGGPQMYTWNEIASLAFVAINKPAHIIRIPIPLARFGIRLLRPFNRKTADLWDFFVESSAMDYAAPSFGTHYLEDHFANLIQKGK